MSYTDPLSFPFQLAIPVPFVLSALQQQ